MNLSFDYYHNLEDTELYLCNPDGRELFPLVGRERNLKLRFNDLSELTFQCLSTTTSSDGTIVNLDSYDYVQTRRRVFATRIGWFVITNVKETDNGVTKIKDVTCSSEQVIFQDKGIYCQEKIYYFYNPGDPRDENYDDADEGSVPSVLGQLYQQLGIKQSILSVPSDPAQPFEDWTITYINQDLILKARTFKETTSNGYEWMVKDVESAFEVIFLFDFYNRAIKVMTPDEVTERANVIYTFSNFMKEVQIEENAENIVTVLNCNGDNCNILNVNPTGTNYICDFSYYMDAEGKWMSSALKTKLAAWEARVEELQPNYSLLIQDLLGHYSEITKLNSQLQEISKIYTDLDAAVVKKSIAVVEGGVAPYGIVWSETVNVGNNSYDSSSRFYSTAFTGSSQVVAFRNQPTYSNGIWFFTGDSITGTADYCYAYADNQNRQYHYFCDMSGGATSALSYCVLDGKAVLNTSTYETEYKCSGFKRYVDLNSASKWEKIYDGKRKALNDQAEYHEGVAQTCIEGLQAISNQCNIINYFSDTPTLLKELGAYWIEGDYTNDNIAILEETPIEEELTLEMELLESGEIELAKVCQPKIQFSLTSVDCTKSYEFANQMSQLELGKIITVEKEEGLWFYPALLEIDYNLDTTDSFTLTFANALRLDDWGYTYGDLLSEASSTSKQVSANWQNITAYSKDKSEITPLIMEPLSSALRATFANMTNQEFTVDDTGILGRKFADDSTMDSFSNEQLRIVNNMIIFTDDNWSTARAALGKITYQHGGSTQTAYGLVADTIIGSLLLGEQLEIKNSGNTVSLNGSGMTILNGGNTVFSASTDGSLNLTGSITATSGYIGGISGFTIGSGKIYSNGRSTLANTTTSGVYIGTDGLSILSDNKASFVRLNLSSSTFEFGGIIYAAGGKFTGDGIEVYGSNGQMSFIDNLGVDTLSVSSDFRSSAIHATNIYLQDPGGGSRTIGIHLPRTTLYDEILTGETSETINLNASVSCSINTEYLTFTATVSTANSATMPAGVFVTVNAQAVYNFGADYGGSTTFTKTIEVYLPKGSSTASATVTTVNRFHVNGTRTSQSVTSYSPTSVTFKTGSDSNIVLNINNHFVPAVTNTYDLGHSNRAWRNIYSTNGVSTTSDARKKKNISYDLSHFDKFYDNIKPALFEFIEDDSKQHAGFIAQDIIRSLGDNHLDINSSGFVSMGDTYFLHYSEFVALNTFEIQKLKLRVKELEKQINLLKQGL